MYNGVFCGKNAASREYKILILGESHYNNNESTSAVVENYLENYNQTGSSRDKAYRFFDRIVRTFGIDPEKHRSEFWDNVFFGNYVEVSCGKGDRQAINAIKAHRNEYNTNLFRFINEQNIDTIYCFSRRVFENLPPVSAPEMWHKDGTDTHRLEECIYHHVTIDGLTIPLRKKVTIYGLRHTSRGYSWKRYLDRIPTISRDYFTIPRLLLD